jgi:hypothetical protein
MQRWALLVLLSFLPTRLTATELRWVHFFAAFDLTGKPTPFGVSSVGTSILTDAAGNAYIAVSPLRATLQTYGWDSSTGGFVNSISKFRKDGTMVYSTGVPFVPAEPNGTFSSGGADLTALDSNGNLFFCGSASWVFFCSTPPCPQSKSTYVSGTVDSNGMTTYSQISGPCPNVAHPPPINRDGTLYFTGSLNGSLSAPFDTFHLGSRFLRSPNGYFFIALTDPNVPDEAKPPEIIGAPLLRVGDSNVFDLSPDVRSFGGTHFQWYTNGLPVPDGNRFFLTNIQPPTLATTYALIVSNDFGASSNIVAFVGPSQQPVLSAELKDKKITLAWPLGANAFQLIESAKSLPIFKPIIASRTTNFLKRRFEIELPFPSGQQFYRLRK